MAFFFGEALRLGTAYRVRVLGRAFTVLSGAAVNIMMATDADAFSAWNSWLPIIRDFGGRQVLTMMEGADHARLRKLMRGTFARETVTANVPAIIGMTLDALAPYADGQPIPTVYTMQKLIATELGLLTNGRTPDDYFDDIMQFWQTQLDVYVAPRKSGKSLETPAFLRAKARADEFARQVVDRRRAIPRDQRDPDNFIDNLLTAHEDDPNLVTEREIVFNALVPYFAGIDTAANTIAFLLAELLRNPAILAQCRAEADSAFAAGIPNAGALRNMDVLHRALMETLRLYPIAGTLPRTAAKDFEIGGYPIRKGDPLLIATCAPHFDPQYYRDPHRFDPDRFLPERAEHKTRGVYAPYGAGIHTCLGASIADAQIALTAATILHSVDFTFADPSYQLKSEFTPGMSPKNLKLTITRWRNRIALPS
jgi:cytochrome P450